METFVIVKYCVQFFHIPIYNVVIKIMYVLYDTVCFMKVYTISLTSYCSEENSFVINRASGMSSLVSTLC